MIGSEELKVTITLDEYRKLVKDSVLINVYKSLYEVKKDK